MLLLVSAMLRNSGPDAENNSGEIFDEIFQLVLDSGNDARSFAKQEG